MARSPIHGDFCAYCVNQLKVDRIYRDKHGEKKKIKICVNPVNPV